MLRYFVLRLIWMFITLFLIVSAVFIVTRFSMAFIWGPRNVPLNQQITIITQQYIDYFKAIIYEWNWGVSMKKEPVWELVSEKMPYTLKVNMIVFAFYVTFGIILGIVSAVKHNSFTDHTIGIVTMIFGSLPSFVLVFPLVIVFGYMLEWLPAQFPIGVLGGSVWNRMGGYIIPIIALAGPPLSTLSRALRGELIDSFESEYMLLARSKGLTRRQLLFRHGIRNSLLPIIPQIPTMFLFVLVNSFFVEVVYNIPGVATLFLRSMWRPDNGGYFLIDVPVVVLITAFYAAISLLASFVGDIASAIVDPTIKLGSKKEEMSETY